MLSSFKIELAEKNIPYITILPTVWTNDKLDVYVVVEPKSKLVSSKYVPDAIDAINKWSELLKQNSNNSNAWNFNVHVKTESLSENERYQFEDRFSPPANIILELKADTQDICNVLGESIPPVDNNRFSVYSYAFTSCAGIELPHEVVYSTVLHELAHDLGLGHAYYKNGDLMCSGEKDKHEHQFITCEASQQLKEVPSDLNIQGLLYRYGADGFDTPNKKLKGEEPRFYQKFALGVNIENKTRIDRLLTVGWTLDDYGKTDQALEYFDKALAIDQNDADSIYAKAYALKTLKMYEQAIPYYDRALAIDPKDADSLYGKGHALEGLGKSDEAITYYDRALAIDPDDVDSLYNKGEILFKSGKYQEALTYYDRILSINPTDSDAATRKNDTMLMLSK
jgi:tetratricopeptide (TPR) repeat protein